MADSSTPQIACPYTAGGCPLFNTILPVDTPRCAGSCSPAPSQPTSPSATAAAPRRPSPPPALPLPPLPELSCSPNTTPDDSLWGAYLDFSIAPTPGPFDSTPYLFSGQELVPGALVGLGAEGGGPPQGEKRGLVDIEELLMMPKKSRVEYQQPAGVAERAGSYESAAEEEEDEVDDSPATPFISKLVYLLGHAEYQQYVRWDPEGKSVVLAHTKSETLDVLTKFFRHTTVASFVRQLNIYGFKRLSTVQLLNVIDPAVSGPSFSAADFCAFQHPEFWRPSRGHPCRLGGLKPVHSKERAARSKKARD